ncbi:phosphoribulokinase [Pyrus ussuriensis x Pyrus communis]|uniref:Phosphoribulokinase n=1 Tax=Pyrus ussuriensis x Pyrus communis TaxID=2448454 RepID=A0A5N5FX30_9ROSA|nr:phosphoribulokinase [Pyrus ussuriensis x Pyrus communis]
MSSSPSKYQILPQSSFNQPEPPQDAQTANNPSRNLQPQNLSWSISIPFSDIAKAIRLQLVHQQHHDGDMLGCYHSLDRTGRKKKGAKTLDLRANDFDLTLDPIAYLFLVS